MCRLISSKKRRMRRPEDQRERPMRPPDQTMQSERRTRPEKRTRKPQDTKSEDHRTRGASPCNFLFWPLWALIILVWSLYRISCDHMRSFFFWFDAYPLSFRTQWPTKASTMQLPIEPQSNHQEYHLNMSLRSPTCTTWLYRCKYRRDRSRQNRSS